MLKGIKLSLGMFSKLLSPCSRLIVALSVPLEVVEAADCRYEGGKT
jgi:hypothetical protein